jgi:EpsD family peptidyl-prolyl cis-trans isomerase
MRTLLFCASLVLLAGCNAPVRQDGKLVAKVNGTEITLQQVASASAGASAAAADKRGTQSQALERVIDRELLVQKALEAGLDRDPEVVQTIESARRQLLAQAYLERAASARGASAAADVQAFYGDNPALFAERRIYRLRELSIPAPIERADLLKSEVARTQSLEAIEEWLRGRGTKYSIATMIQPAEQLPLRYLPQLARMKEGEVAWFASPLGASVIQVVQAQQAPLSEQQAAPLIEQFLAGRKRLELAAAEVRRLREVASIEYLGDFRRN